MVQWADVVNWAQSLDGLQRVGALASAYFGWRLVTFVLRLVEAARVPSRVYEKLPRAGDDRNAAALETVSLSTPPPTVRALLASIEAGERTVEEVVDTFIARASACSALTNCVVPIDEMERAARAAATELDVQSESLATLPLRGLPVSIKECYLVRGTPSTHGLVKYADAVCADPACEAALVQILRRLGAVPFCKTNVPQIMYAWECANPVYGTTSHPLHRHFIPGGSSGGEAALIAQGGSIIGCGSDVGGSCRIPAHMAGCVGLKLTKHRVAMRGKGLDVTYGAGQAIVASCNGLLSNTVDDCAAVLAAVLSAESIAATRRSLDVMQLPLPWRDDLYRGAEGGALTIGYYDDDGFLEAAPACRRAVNLAVERLRAEGHTLVPFQPPRVEHAFHVYIALMSAGAEHIAAALEGEQLAASMAKVGFIFMLCTVTLCANPAHTLTRSHASILNLILNGQSSWQAPSRRRLCGPSLPAQFATTRRCGRSACL